jgi:hypothetical protein
MTNWDCIDISEAQNDKIIKTNIQNFNLNQLLLLLNRKYFKNNININLVVKFYLHMIWKN